MAPTVLITGASQGSSKAAALLFARHGYDVVLVARRNDRLADVAHDINALGRQALAIPADVGKPNEVAAMVQQALDGYGAIDVLVNNAGICLTGAIEQTTLEDWHHLMDTNFWGYVHTIQALLPHFLERGNGTIVNVGSIGGKMPIPDMTAYCASKYAITGLTDALRLELKPKGIHVGVVHPGVINSSFMERAIFRGNDADHSQSLQSRMQTMLGSAWASQPDQVAKAIWDVVEKQQPEAVVGTAVVATEAYRLVPGLVQWMLAQAAG
jgi:short-subunit dehydrogenase